MTTTPTTLTGAGTLTPAEQAAAGIGADQSAAPSTSLISPTGVIGMSQGQTPVGIGPEGPQLGPGIEQAPGNIQPGEQNTPITQFGTTVNPSANAYKANDEWAPGAGTPPQIAAMQAQLVQAGLLTPADVRAGLWDAKSADAYKVVLAFANVHGMNASDALAVLEQNPAAGTAAYRYPISLTNQIQSQADFASTSAQLTGGGLPASEAQAFSTYQTGLEEQARARYVSSKTDKNSAYVGAPSAAAGARAYILAHNPGDVASYDLALRTIQFLDAVKEL